MTEEAFLQAVLDDPEDDAPRLVYADWLDDRDRPGDAERAEFIRLQIDLAKRDEGDPRRAELEVRQQVLLRRHEEEWARPLHERNVGGEFRRGFVEELRLLGDRFLAEGEGLFRLAPVRSVELMAVGSELSEVARSPLLGRLAGLRIESASNLTEAGFRDLLASPHLGKLTSLTVQTFVLGESAVRSLAGSPLAARLRELGLDGVEFGRGGAEALASRLGGLERLSLCDNHLGPGEWEPLAGPVSFPALAHLRLAGNRLGSEDGGRPLPPLPRWGRLRTLGLGFGGLLTRDLQTLAGSPHLDALAWLRLYENPVGVQAARALASTPWLAGLRNLYLGRCSVGDQALGILADSPNLRGLRDFRLLFNDVGPAGARALAESPHLAGLVRLDLRCNPLGVHGVKALASSPHLAGLRELDLGDAGVGDAGARALAESPYLDRVESLIVQGAGSIRRAGREALKARFGDRVLL
jgi:uncharacterized protein (TIGR02996 family)